MGELYRLNFPNGKAYIGIACNGAMGRFLSHRWAATNADQLLYRAWRKYGEPVLQVLAVVEDAVLHETEVKAIASYRTLTPTGYNMTLGGEGTLGRIASPETLARMSAVSRNPSPETRAKMSAAASNQSPETRAKIGAKSRLRVCSPETRAKLSAAARNMSTERRAKLRLRVVSPETRAKLSTANRGKVLSPETRAKISAAVTQRWARHHATNTERSFTCVPT